MAKRPRQPKDETPLPGYVANGQVPNAAAGLADLKSQVKTARQAVIDAANEQLGQLKSQVATTYLDTLGPAAADVQSVKTEMAPHYVGVMKNLGKVQSSIQSTLQDGYTELWQQGVKTPINRSERTADLADLTGQSFASRFIPVVGGNPVVPIPPPVSPPPTSPPPVLNVGPPCDSASIAPTYINGVPTCPTGWTVTGGPPGGYKCVPMDCSITLPTSPPLSPPPPFSPPPIAPPPAPPPPPGLNPPPPLGGACNDPQPASLVQCLTVTKPPPPVSWWITADCSDRCAPNVCVWSGQLPPTQFTGAIVAGPLAFRPSIDDINAAIVAYCPNVTPITPPSPPAPPPPPVKPPPPPPSPPPPVVCTPAEQTIAFIKSPTGATCDEEEVPPNEVVSATWDEIDLCTSIHDQIIAGLQRGKVPTITDTEPHNTKSWWELGMDYAWSATSAGAFSGLFSALTPDVGVGKFKQFAADLWGQTSYELGKILDSVTWNSVPNSKSAISLGVQLAALNRLQLATGFPLDYLSMSTKYLYQYANPQYIPSQSDLDRMYMHGQLSKEQWRCYTKANGNIPDLAWRALHAGQVKPNPAQIISLYRRGNISTDKYFHERMREMGVLNKVHVDELYALSDVLPSSSEIIRYMVRDVFDDNVVTRYGLNTSFAEKYTKDAAKLGRAAGLSNDKALLDWRAHWIFPSNTVAYEMLRRLRPDRKAVKQWEFEHLAWTVSGKGGPEPMKPPVFTRDDMIDVLQVNDHVPGLIQNEVDISYRPITNTDASRMFDLGYIEKPELIDRLQDNGYNLDDSTTIAGFYAAEKAKRISNISGVWTVRKVIASYKDGFLDYDTAMSLLTPIINDNQTRLNVMNGAQLEIKIDRTRSRVKALKRRYMYGEFDDVAIALALKNAGVVESQIARIVDTWSGERIGHAKEPRVTMVCEWYSRRIITLPQYADRLQKLGYSETDAANIMKTCAAVSQAKAASAAATAAAHARAQLSFELREQQAENKLQLQQMEEEYKQAQIRLEEVKIKVEQERLAKLQHHP